MFSVDVHLQLVIFISLKAVSYTAHHKFIRFSRCLLTLAAINCRWRSTKFSSSCSRAVSWSSATPAATCCCNWSCWSLHTVSSSMALTAMHKFNDNIQTTLRACIFNEQNEDLSLQYRDYSIQTLCNRFDNPCSIGFEQSPVDVADAVRTTIGSPYTVALQTA